MAGYVGNQSCSDVLEWKLVGVIYLRDGILFGDSL